MTKKKVPDDLQIELTDLLCKSLARSSKNRWNGIIKQRYLNIASFPYKCLENEVFWVALKHVFELTEKDPPLQNYFVLTSSTQI